jgi:hypothetical protein
LLAIAMHGAIKDVKKLHEDIQSAVLNLGESILKRRHCTRSDSVVIVAVRTVFVLSEMRECDMIEGMVAWLQYHPYFTKPETQQLASMTRSYVQPFVYVAKVSYNCVQQTVLL